MIETMIWNVMFILVFLSATGAAVLSIASCDKGLTTTRKVVVTLLAITAGVSMMIAGAVHPYMMQEKARAAMMLEVERAVHARQLNQ